MLRRSRLRHLATTAAASLRTAPTRTAARGPATDVVARPRRNRPRSTGRRCAGEKECAGADRLLVLGCCVSLTERRVSSACVVVQTCPLLLRVFPQVGAPHELSEYDLQSGRVPSGELQIYTWRDASLRELTELVKEVQPQARRKEARLAFALVYPDSRGRLTLRPVGTTFASGKRSEDDRKTLHSLKFQTGDFLDVAILTHAQQPPRDQPSHYNQGQPRLGSSVVAPAATADAAAPPPPPPPH